MEEVVLSYYKIKDRIAEGKITKEKVLKNLDEIRAEFSESYIRTFEKFLDTTLPKLYDGINFNENGVDFKKLVTENQVVLVPNHQSHADYLAINYMVFKNYRFPLYVAGGNNLNIFPIGPLFRKSGCFFIRRSFHNDIGYKPTLEAYLKYLLHEKKPIEFFFEGGRSRTGKLLPPRYGLYSMLLEAHADLPEDKKAPLMFVPVSINHEYVPEQKSLAREAKGGKKKKESTGQLFGLLGLFAQQFGSVHINLGQPVEGHWTEDKDKQKKLTQDLAFKCFRAVGANMVVTPSSLLAMVLLDEPQGALKWEEIKSKACAIMDFCRKFDVPHTNSLNKAEFESSLERAMDIMIGNKKIDVIGGGEHEHVFYSIKEEARAELLYFKNTILHHFLLPWGINAAWIALFCGEIEDVGDLRRFFLRQRNMMKHEFYLPATREFMAKTLQIISDLVGKEIKMLEECLELSHKELYAIASKLGVFARAMNYINESYYVSALTIKFLAGESGEDPFKVDHYNKKYKEIFDQQHALGRVIKYQESYNLTLVKSSFKYFSQDGFLDLDNGYWKVADIDKFNKALKEIENQLIQSLSFNLRVPN